MIIFHCQHLVTLCNISVNPAAANKEVSDSGCVYALFRTGTMLPSSGGESIGNDSTIQAEPATLPGGYLADIAAVLRQLKYLNLGSRITRQRLL